MTSTVRLLANSNNAVPGATVSASSVLPVEHTVYPTPTTRAGNGTIVLSGAYAGANDATLELEIRPSGGAAVTVTDPVLAGAGNGTMVDLVADPGTVDQSVTVTLADLGTITTAAQVALWSGILLRAKTAGAGGNALSLTVTPHLTLSASPVGALSFALTAQTFEWSDPRGNFGAEPLMPDGTLPTTAPRLAFGGNLTQVYRHYQRWDGERWQYGISPAAATDYAAGDLVHTVTGDYTVTITDGGTTETYAGVVTLYDFLLALNASALVEVVGVVALDARPSGIAAIDLPMRTQSVLLSVVRDPGSLPDLTNVTLADHAPTETITITCTKNAPLGAETWAVKSRVAGELPPATTGVPYDGEFLDFTIPAVTPATIPTQGALAIVKMDLAGADEDPPAVPAICLYRPRLGIKASPKTLKLVYKRRPLSDCDCKTASIDGDPSPDCLGQDAAEGGVVATLIAGYQSRLDDLYTWRQEFITANTELNTTNGMLTTVFQDVELADQVTATFADCLTELYDDSDTPDSDALNLWDTHLAQAGIDLTQLATMEAEPTVGVVTWESGTGFTSSTPILPPAQKANGHQYKIVPLSFEQGLIWVIPDTFFPTEDPATWPTDGGAIAISGQASYSGVLYSDRTALLIDLGPWATADNVTTADPATADPATLRRSVEQFVRRYAAQMDLVRVKAGIVPKSDASGAGSPCWRDPGDAFWWEFEDTSYLPLFSNVYYHSCILAADAAASADATEPTRPQSTYEFGFALQIACTDRLRVGDAVWISINDVSAVPAYAIGAQYTAAMVSGGPLLFAGGVTGTDTLTWAVKSNVQGVLADYPLGLAEAPYRDGGFGFTIHRGTLDFALGDAFTFAVETGGQFRWRANGGAWSADTAIAASVALADGLNAAFTRGVSPSFVVGDTYTYTVLQPHSPSHCQTAHDEAWRWEGTAAAILVDFGADTVVTCAGVLRHGLSAGATVTLSLYAAGSDTLGTDGGDTLVTAAGAALAAATAIQTISPTVVAGQPLLAFFPAVTARLMVVTVAAAADMALGWLYAGQPLATEHQPTSCVLRRYWALERGGGVNPRASYLGRGRGGEIVWDTLTQADASALATLIDALKTDDDAPLVLVPHTLHPTEAALCRVASDDLELSDVFAFQPNDAARRVLSATVPLTAVLQ